MSVNCEDGQCFQYAVAASLRNLPASRHPNRAHHYIKLVSAFKGKQDYMSVKDIKTFERLNKLQINVFGWNDTQNKLKILHLSNKSSATNCDIFLYNSHYFAIRNSSRLIKKPNTRKVRSHICRRCYLVFNSINAYGKHIIKCNLQDKPGYLIPAKNTFLELKNFKNIAKRNIVYYCDFETMLIDHKTVRGENTFVTKRHVPVSFGLLRVSTNEQFNKGPIIVHGEDVMTKFWNILNDEYYELLKIVELTYPLHMSSEQKRNFKSSTHCYICGIEFTLHNYKCKDHCHLTPLKNYRGPLCNRCNLTYASSRLFPVPIVIHKLSGYDSHLLMRAIKQIQYVRIIPKNTEKVLSLTVESFKFIDSLAFLPTSLQNLVNSLKQEKGSSYQKYFPLTKKIAQNQAQMECVYSKNPYPYNYCQMLTDYDLPCLPPREHFYDSLKKLIYLKPIMSSHNMYSKFLSVIRYWTIINCTSNWTVAYWEMFLKIFDVFHSIRMDWTL